MKDLLEIIKEIPLFEGKELSWTPLSGGGNGGEAIGDKAFRKSFFLFS